MLAGIGNIHATEALYRAGIDPRRPGNRLDRALVEQLALAIRASLDHAFVINGPGEITYLSEGGHVQNDFLIYDHAGEPCPRCGRVIWQYDEIVAAAGKTDFSRKR